MGVDFNITTSNAAYDFLLDVLGLYAGELIMEYLVDCSGNVDMFVERNLHRLAHLDIFDVRFIAYHVTASLDDCEEIKRTGIRDLRYVLSHNTMLSNFLDRGGIQFDIENRAMLVDGDRFNIDYDFYRNRQLRTPEEKLLENIAHRVCYDFCVDGFLTSDDVKRYGTDIDKRPEFILKLIKVSPKVKELDEFWRSNSKPYKVYFYVTADQIHKFTFNLNNNYLPYSAYEQEQMKRWMLGWAVDRAFNTCGDLYIYIRDHEYVPPEQIINCELMNQDE